MATRKRKADNKNASPSRKRVGRGKKRNKTTPIIARESRGMPITRSLRIEITDRPRQAVFATAELLENILLHVPAKQVFALQRTAKQFRDIKLFLQPPIACSAGLLAFKDEKLALVSNFADIDLGLQQGLELQTFLAQPAFHSNSILHLVPARKPRARPSMWLDCDSLALGIPSGFKKISGDHSWKKTYLTDRPCKDAYVFAFWEIRAKSYIRGDVRLKHLTTEDSHGFTLGSLVDAALAAVETRADGANRASECYVGGTLRSHDGPVIDLIRALEAETGKAATFHHLQIAMRDVLLVDEGELSAARVFGETMKPNDGQ
ncbi:hypothetical protein LTR97_001083 [Elasticomyces elasticus]|uniref:F-box domain-containing protein n=1 Tax=Elasticomyces elasticus TaxID=574655 RepID=A0AAN7WBZ5_9PEZI|nr:hypothetical protein LTR97_001083 [Elasticomyces elasticus]